MTKRWILEQDKMVIHLHSYNISYRFWYTGSSPSDHGVVGSHHFWHDHLEYILGNPPDVYV